MSIYLWLRLSAVSGYRSHAKETIVFSESTEFRQSFRSAFYIRSVVRDYIVIDDTLGSMLRISINNLQLCVTNFIVYRIRSFASSLLIAVPRERTGINKLVIEFTVFDIDEDSLRDERKFHLGVLWTLVDFLS